MTAFELAFWHCFRHCEYSRKVSQVYVEEYYYICLNSQLCILAKKSKFSKFRFFIIARMNKMETVNEL